MIKMARNCSKILAGLLLAMLLAACGSKKAETTAISSTAPDPGSAYSHSVALSSGSIYSWGVNIYGQLGIGNIVAKSTPVAVLGGAAGTVDLTGMKGVSAGGTHTLAFVDQGPVYAWGNNAFGELGDNSIIARTKPVKVLKSITTTDFLDGITAIAAGGNQFSLALDSNHAVWAWGNNSVGQLGLKTLLTPTLEKVAVQVDLTDNITMIAAGGGHGLALDSDKTVWSWGLNTFGQLGRVLATTNTNSPTPGQVVKADGTGNLPNVIHIAAGGGHSLFVDGDGNVWSCGQNNHGQLGDGSQSDRKDGVKQVLKNGNSATPLTGATAVAAGLDHSLALMSDKTVLAWGINKNGQLGNPNTVTAVTSPVPVLMGPSPGTPLPDIVKIVAIGNHSLAVDSSGKLWAWGDNTYGQLGNGKTKDSAYAIEVTDIPNPDLYMPVPLP